MSTTISKSKTKAGNRASASDVENKFGVEKPVFAIVIAIIAWPLVSLLMVLAQTANGSPTRRPPNSSFCFFLRRILRSAFLSPYV